MEVGDKKKFPVALTNKFQTDKQDLFYMWKDANGDWGEVLLRVERTAAKYTKAKAKEQKCKVMDLVRWGYSQEDAEKIRDLKMAQGLAEYDKMFPGKAEHIKFWFEVEVSAEEGFSAQHVKLACTLSPPRVPWVMSLD